MSKSQLIQLEYEKHPAFIFNAKPYSINLEKISAFDKTYKMIADCSDTKKTDFQNINYDLMRLLSEIFDEMRVQVDDEYELMFINELEIKSTNLLKTEICFYRSIDNKKISKEPEGEFLNALKTERHFFGALDKESIAEIVKLSSDVVDMLSNRAIDGKLTREDLSINSGKVVSDIVAVLNREFSSQGVLDALSGYMGNKYKVGGLALELSSPNATWWKSAFECTDSPKTIYAHLDESIEFPKAIVYISEVGERNGQTSCYPGAYECLSLNALQELIGRVISAVGSGEQCKLNDYYAKKYHQSMSSERFRQHFMKLPAELRFNSHFGWDVIADSDIERSLLKKEKKMSGRGTFIVFDGAKLLHRGGLLEEGKRVVLQVVFIKNPTIIQKIVTFPRRVISKIQRLLK